MTGHTGTRAATRQKADDLTSPANLRVLIVDDSLVLRSVVERIVDGTTGFKAVASLSSADAALDYLSSNRVDIIILDIEMPHRTGLDALPDLIAASGNARILVLSSHCAAGAPATLRALALGASDTLAKPDQQLYSRGFTAMLSERLHMLAEATQLSGTGMPPILARLVSPHSALECLAIGSSTGGISAIHEFLTVLDPLIDAPIVITQHLPVTFIPYLVRQIDDLGLRPARLGVDGAVLEKGHVYCAPGDSHMGLQRRGSQVRIALIPDWPNTVYKPSVDPMFMAVAQCYGARSAAVMLSGMGSDGLEGAKALAECGAAIYAQDAKTSTVWGMPGAVARAGLASVVLPPAGIAQFIADCWLETV